jgi:pilus assembly protein Flp/PilA
MSIFQRFLAADSGATAIAYGLIAAGISVVIIGIVNTLGKQLNSTRTPRRSSAVSNIGGTVWSGPAVLLLQSVAALCRMVAA